MSSRTMIIVLLCVITIALAATAFLVGKSSGPKLENARAQGAKAGTALIAYYELLSLVLTVTKCARTSRGGAVLFQFS